MKKSIFAALVVLTSACSSPKYAANFQSYPNKVDYTSIASSPKIEPEDLTASTLGMPAEKKAVKITGTEQPVRKTYLQMSKSERKELRRYVKAEWKKYVNSSKVNTAPAPPAGEWSKWDQDLKLAAIFGAVGTTGLIINVEPFFIIGAIALIIGVVFLVKWLIRQ